MSQCMWLLSIMMTMFIQFHQAAVSSSYNATAKDLCPSMQKLALFQFKLGLSVNTSSSTPCLVVGGGTLQPKTMSWNMNSDCCTWNGVTCNQTTGDVIGLDLTCSSLVGSIPRNSTLFQLSHLQSLDFGINNLNGVFPEEIFHLPNLKSLRLFYNPNLTVSLPKVKWGSHRSLQMLSIIQSTISGGIPDSIGFLKSLTSLLIRACEVTGTIPRSIGNLTQLTVLDLDVNKLVGNIPISIANLRKLEILDLSKNLLSGPLPSNLTTLHLPNLATLSLWNNFLNGTLPFWLFDHPSLEEISIGANRFTGQLYEFDSSKSQLKKLNCRNNLLHGKIPQSFSKLVNLSSLDLSSNNFNGVLNIEMFSSLKYLEVLDLSYNSLSLKTASTTMFPSSLYRLGLSSCKIMKFPHFIKSLPNLEYLDLSYNSLSLETASTTMFPSSLHRLGLSSCKIMKFPHFIKSLPNLEYLDLSNNQIDGEIPQWINSIWTYQSFYLYLSHNRLTGGLEYLPWNNLKYLDFQFNMLNGSLPASICNSSSLDVLNLSHNNLSGVLPECPRSLDNSVSVLDLRDNSIGGSLPSTLSNFRKLRSLNLHGNNLEGTIPVSFAEFDYLEVLDLGSNRINDTFPQCLEALPSLQVLVLKSNKFHGFIKSNLTIDHPFPSLRIIDLSYNEFSGLLPAKYIRNFNAMMNGDANHVELKYMGNSFYKDSISVVLKGVEFDIVKILTVLTTIDLSQNRFEGDIPKYIGNLVSLRFLNLSNNHLTGNMPSLVGNLSMLESLDLSSNKLVGKIPQQLTSIYSLARLNLSQNNLSDHIPEGAQFDTFGNDSYAGNLGLCGPPLSKKCEREITETQEEEEDENDVYFFNGFTWKALVIGYGGGVVVGFLVGNMMFVAGRPKWFTGIIARELGLKVRRMEIRRFA